MFIAKISKTEKVAAKLTAVLLLTAMLMTSLTGCGGDGGSTAEADQQYLAYIKNDDIYIMLDKDSSGYRIGEIFEDEKYYPHEQMIELVHLSNDGKGVYYLADIDDYFGNLYYKTIKDIKAENDEKGTEIASHVNIYNWFVLDSGSILYEKESGHYYVFDGSAEDKVVSDSDFFFLSGETAAYIKDNELFRVNLSDIDSAEYIDSADEGEILIVYSWTTDMEKIIYTNGAYGINQGLYVADGTDVETVAENVMNVWGVPRSDNNTVFYSVAKEFSGETDIGPTPETSPENGYDDEWYAGGYVPNPDHPTYYDVCDDDMEESDSQLEDELMDKDWQDGGQLEMQMGELMMRNRFRLKLQDMSLNREYSYELYAYDGNEAVLLSDRAVSVENVSENGIIFSSTTGDELPNMFKMSDLYFYYDLNEWEQEDSWGYGYQKALEEVRNIVGYGSTAVGTYQVSFDGKSVTPIEFDIEAPYIGDLSFAGEDIAYSTVRERDDDMYDEPTMLYKIEKNGSSVNVEMISDSMEYFIKLSYGAGGIIYKVDDGNSAENATVHYYNGTEDIEIDYDVSMYKSIDCYEDGTVLYWKNYEDSDGTAELYVFDGENKYRVAHDVYWAEMMDGEVYFLKDMSGSSGDLYKYIIGAEEPVEVDYDVESFFFVE